MRPTRVVSEVAGSDGGVLLGIRGARPPLVLLLLPLHAPVLEPDLDVALGETERERELDAPRPRDVLVEEELLLQLEQLRARVGRARALVLLGLRRVRTCRDARDTHRSLYS